MEKFDLTEKSRVLIYGGGALGQKIYKQIREVYDVMGIIDKKKLTLNTVGNSLPAYQVDDLNGLQDCAVIICVHNAAWHYEIAEVLYAAGFSKILFSAVQSIFDQNMAICMKRMYALFLEGDYNNLKSIPCYGTLKKRPYAENIIRRNSKSVVTFCRRELIFSFNGVEEHNKDKIKDEHLQYHDCPLPGFRTYISLMNYFMNGKNNPDIYISLMKDVNNSFVMDEKEFLEDQWGVYQLLEQEYEKGIEAFQYAPVDVAWNKKGYFNILDGHHRAAFWYVKGIHNFPVRMKQEDYGQWLNADKVEAVEKALKTAIPQRPVIHPYFAGADYMIHEYEESTPEIVLAYIYEENKKYKSLLDAGGYGGEFARSIYRSARAERIVLLTDEKEYGLQKALNELYYVPEEGIRLEKRSIEDLNDYFQCAIICGKYSLEELRKISEFFDLYISDEIIWQSKDKIEEEKNFILTSTKFSSYKSLGRKCVNGKPREIGVFTRDE